MAVSANVPICGLKLGNKCHGLVWFLSPVMLALGEPPCHPPPPQLHGDGAFVTSSVFLKFGNLEPKASK